MIAMSRSVPETQILKNIHRVSLSLKQKTLTSYPHLSKHVAKPSPLPTNVAAPTLDLSFPYELLAPLSAIDSKEAQTHLTQFFTQKILQLQQKYISHYQQASTHPSTSTFDMRSMYRTMYERRCFPLLKEQVSRAVDELSKQQVKKPSFNSDFTPVLEAYFELNAYPSLRDRQQLAVRSMMAPRQIEVWFQNHRNRSKKEGRAIKRAQSLISLDDVVSSVHLSPQTNGMQRLPSPTPSFCSNEEESETIYSQSRPASPGRADDFFLSIPRPSHAFPTPYPPKSDVDPFGRNASRFHFSQSCWVRQSAAPASIPSACDDMDALCHRFQTLLSLRTSHPTKERKKSPTSQLCPWYFAGTTSRHVAPHPSFVQQPPSLERPSDPKPHVFSPRKPTPACPGNKFWPSWSLSTGLSGLEASSNVPKRRPSSPSVSCFYSPRSVSSSSSTSSVSSFPSTPDSDYRHSSSPYMVDRADGFQALNLLLDLDFSNFSSSLPESFHKSFHCTGDFSRNAGFLTPTLTI
ncbi:hypothetical protein BJ165DRAFT_1431038 [Panaeolus papilionaceus]|nr:hypothetical protein BJ165DRAFT_1431038 [Panaeolus papilionaceus]